MSNKYGIMFPFEPYPQQQELMNAIFESIEGSRSGCFESPTGTGKSLSVICATLHWQRIREKEVEEQFEKKIEEEKNSTKKEASSSDDWLSDMLNASSSDDKSKEKSARQKERSLKTNREMKERVLALAEVDNKNVRSNEVKTGGASTSSFRGIFGLPVVNKGQAETPSDKSLEQIEEEFILAHYDSDDSKKKGKRNKARMKSNAFLASQLDLADKAHKRGRYEEIDTDSDEEEREEEMEEENELRLPQVFYCSRTHSQLAQFVEELRKTTQGRNVRCVTLGSRKNLCINPDVLKLGTDAKISDKCLDMAKSKGGKADPPSGAKKAPKLATTRPCEFHRAVKEDRFGDYAMAKVRDIEELVGLGRQLDACPYYGTRKSIQNAQVVCMPYATLLSADTRESMGIRLKDNVVIFDEAHNVIEAVNHANSAEVSKQDLDLANQAVSTYLNRFQGVLAGRNLYYVQLLNSVVQKLQSFLGKMERQMHKNDVAGGGIPTSNSMELLSANDFIFRAKLDNVNLFKLRRHIRESNLVGKMGGYSEYLAKKEAAMSSDIAVGQTTDPPSVFSHAIRCVASLLTCLTNADADGRIALSVNSQKEKGPSQSNIRFLLLNPSSHFRSIAEETRSVLLLGGTLQPFRYLANSLFVHTSKPPSTLTYFSCGHVVNSSNVLATVVEKGPDGRELSFTHGTKFDKSLTTALLFSLTRLSQVAPNGMVVFMTSYSYLDFVVSQWRSGGLLHQLRQHKELFVEPRGVTEADNVWNDYSKAVGRGVGAILFCVMGGKLSEGINFSNDLARCVVVVGMPYPDSRDPVLQEKMKQAEKLELSCGSGGSNVMSAAGKMLYEALCMNSVNQSIGRSIRHAGDYASILLLDKRYKQERVIKQLPSWIQSSYCAGSTLNDVAASLKDFYGRKKS